MKKLVLIILAVFAFAVGRAQVTPENMSSEAKTQFRTALGIDSLYTPAQVDSIIQEYIATLSLDDDDVTLADVQAALSNDFHNVGGTDDDIPDSGDLGIIDTEAEFESELFELVVPGELDYYTDSDIDGSESAFDGWDKNASDDFDGDYGSLANRPSGLDDGDDDTQLNESQVEAFIDGDEASFSGWDKNASDDFDGAYSSLTGTPDADTTLNVISYSSSPTYDYSNGSGAKLTLAGNVDKLTIINMPPNSFLNIEVHQDGTGGYGIDTIYMADYTTNYASGVPPSSDYTVTDAESEYVLSIWTTDSIVHAGFNVYALDIIAFQAVFDSTDLAVGTVRAGIPIPAKFTVKYIYATVTVEPTGAGTTIDINENGTSILSTKITLDDGEDSSSTAAIPPVISDSELTAFNQISVDVDANAATTPAKGLWIILKGIWQ